MIFISWGKSSDDEREVELCNILGRLSSTLSKEVFSSARWDVAVWVADVIDASMAVIT